MYRVHLGDCISVEFNPDTQVLELFTTDAISVGDRIPIKADHILKLAEIISQNAFDEPLDFDYATP